VRGRGQSASGTFSSATRRCCNPGFGGIREESRLLCSLSTENVRKGLVESVRRFELCLELHEVEAAVRSRSQFILQETMDHHLYPNPASHLVMTNGDHLRYYEFLGKILGKVRAFKWHHFFSQATLIGRSQPLRFGFQMYVMDSYELIW
jgi:hypothetical protein